MGVGVSGIGANSTTNDKSVFLTGEGGNDLGMPNALALPKTVLDEWEVVTMSKEEFKTTITAKGSNHSWPLLTKARINGTTSMV